MLVLDHALDAHEAIPPEVWHPHFRNAQGKGKWQELQFIASLVALAVADMVFGADRDERIERAFSAITKESSNWKRPPKTQSKAQWEFIGHTVAEFLSLLEIDVTDADQLIRDRFGHSGLKMLVEVRDEQ